MRPLGENLISPRQELCLKVRQAGENFWNVPGTSGIRIHGHGRPLGAKNQDPSFGPQNRSLYGQTEHKSPIFKISSRGL